MKGKLEQSPSSSPKVSKEATSDLSPRELEERRLRNETNGHFAPTKPYPYWEERRRKKVAEYVADGLRQFDLRQEQEAQRQVEQPQHHLEPGHDRQPG